VTLSSVEVVCSLLDLFYSLEWGLLLETFELKSPGGLFDFSSFSAKSSGAAIVGLLSMSEFFLFFGFVEASPSELDSEI